MSVLFDTPAVVREWNGSAAAGTTVSANPVIGATAPRGAMEVRDALAEESDSGIAALLRSMAGRGASDLLLVAGWPPIFGIRGRWAPQDAEPLDASEVGGWLHQVLTPSQLERLTAERDLDFALRLPEAGRFRVNAHYQNGGPAIAVRAVPASVPRLEQLGLPPQAEQLAQFPHGLVLVTGGTGHGKSTTLAALIARLNDTRPCHIITLEDPIEFEFPHRQAIIEQREIGFDSPSFGSALRHVVRQRPDVILVGEMRDLDTISIALTAAETGHLVMASLHTCNTSQALARIIDVFPPVQQQHVRTQLAASLRAILGEVLLPTADTEGMTPAAELLFTNDAIRRAIRDNETHLIYGMIETGRDAGMQTLEQALAALVLEGRVEAEAARSLASYPNRFDRLIQHGGA